MTITPDLIREHVDTALQIKSDNRPRTLQKIIGPSNLGFCRQQAALITREIPQSDAKSTRAADWGTALHEWIQDALHATYPTWLLEHKVTAEFKVGPRMFTISGHADIIAPEWNAVLDIKTVDGYQYVKRNGASQGQRWQRYTYAKGAIAAGLLDPSKPIWLGNVWVDRSAREKQVHVGELEEYNPHLDDEIGQWLEDVVYAVENKEDADRDIAPEVCAQICEWFTICRGTLPDENAERITDPGLIDAVKMYDEARATIKEAEKDMAEAKAMLDGHSGIAGGLQVRWTEVGPTDVQGFTKRGYTKIAVVPVKGQR